EKEQRVKPEKDITRKANINVSAGRQPDCKWLNNPEEGCGQPIKREVPAMEVCKQARGRQNQQCEFDHLGCKIIHQRQSPGVEQMIQSLDNLVRSPADNHQPMFKQIFTSNHQMIADCVPLSGWI